MHVAERNRELERQRKQRQIRTRSFTRPEPTHGRHAARVSCRGRTILPVRACRFSNNVTLPRFGPSGGLVAVYFVCFKKSTIRPRNKLNGSADNLFCRGGAKPGRPTRIPFPPPNTERIEL